MTFDQVYRVVSRNGGVRRTLQPSDAQCRLLAQVIVDRGVRFDLGEWSGRTKWQMSQMIASILRGALND